MQAASKRQFPSGQLMNTDHMVSRFDAKIKTRSVHLGHEQVFRDGMFLHLETERAKDRNHKSMTY